MKISDYFMDVGQLLGTRMRYNNQATTLWWRVLSWEQANYRYTWGTTPTTLTGATIAANTASSGPFNDILSTTNTYVLMPQQNNVLFHYFVGVWPSTQLVYMQYPNQQDHNALTGYRSVDANGQGAFDGRTTQPYNPAPETEIITMADLRPTYAIYNKSDVTVTPQMWFYARMYLVAGPYLDGNKNIPDQATIQSYLETGKARVVSLYGDYLIDVPSRFASIIGQS